MDKQGYIIAVDQGTTGTTGVVVDSLGKVLCQSYQEIRQIYPEMGWVEHDPSEIFSSVLNVIEDLLEETEINIQQILGLGIANQRETTLVWEKTTGSPVYNAIVWQCRRTSDICHDLKLKGLSDYVRSETGLPIDAYFSATKIRWILDKIENGQQRAENGELAFGTVDSWLMWNLTNGTLHATDVTNASRTMLFNTRTMDWDETLLNTLMIPRTMMPKVHSSSEIFAHVGGNFLGGVSIPIAGVAGDQNAALFGQACFEPGMTKNTYGTGSFVLMNTGDKRVTPSNDLITTPAWAIGDQVTYALEGSIYSTGATVQWLRDGLEFFENACQIESLAQSVGNNGGVYIVPAFTGLGAPHWDMYARCLIIGATRGTTRAHICRAALESTAFQTRDVIEAMKHSTGLDISVLRVDGGGTANNLLMQMQSDLLDAPILISSVQETTALGAAFLAGLALGVWDSIEKISTIWQCRTRLDPLRTTNMEKDSYDRWKRAVELSKGWASV